MTTSGNDKEGSKDADTEDCDQANVMLRAGYLLGLAMRLEGDDREYVLRASKSLLAFGNMLAQLAEAQE